jgi:hypothetical protein
VCYLWRVFCRCWGMMSSMDMAPEQISLLDIIIRVAAITMALHAGLEGASTPGLGMAFMGFAIYSEWSRLTTPSKEESEAVALRGAISSVAVLIAYGIGIALRDLSP